MLKLWLLCALASLVSAQTAWNGLRFHMNENDAKKHLKDQGIDIEPVGGDQKHQIASTDYELSLPDSLITFPFQPELNFGSDGLNIISLNLDQKKYSERINDTFSMVTIAATKFYDALVTKYGLPVSIDGPCSKITVEALFSATRVVTCDAKWRGESQRVSMYWSYDPQAKRFACFLQYMPQASGL